MLVFFWCCGCECYLIVDWFCEDYGGFFCCDRYYCFVYVVCLGCVEMGWLVEMRERGEVGFRLGVYMILFICNSVEVRI